MMDLMSHVAVNGPDVIHETIAGEAVIINLMSGRYYSLQGTGTEIWNLIGEGAVVSGIVASMVSRYPDTDLEMRRIVVLFLEQLREENLIRVEPAGESASGAIPETEATAGASAQSSGFALPTLQVFTDLEDLLLLDPIHEVDEEGWPVARPADSPEERSEDPLNRAG